jgi:Mn2+/Fe2+ NRAMP family transporter
VPHRVRRQGPGQGTVIPVLFLAIAFQGPAYQNMMKAISTAASTWRGPWSKRQLAAMVAIGAVTAAALWILGWGVAGEILAIGSLSVQQGRSRQDKRERSGWHHAAPGGYCAEQGFRGNWAERP